MALSLSLPLGKKDNVKNLVFTILTREYPLKIIELTNYIRKRYGRSVTFQAVRKAILELVEDNVLIRKGNEFLINKEWVKESKGILDDLYENLTKEKTTPRRFDSIGGEVSVFTFNSMTEMMKFWQQIIDDWCKKFRKGDPNINCYQAAHIWELLILPDKERQIMDPLKKKGIKSYAICTGSTPLDMYIARFYKKIGIKIAMTPSIASFDKGYYVGTYGDLIVQCQYPEKIVSSLDHFFKTNNTIEELDIEELHKVMDKKVQVKLTVIKNLQMAQQINKSIMQHIV